MDLPFLFGVWIDHFPILFHVDHGPTARRGLIERFVEFADGRFAVVGPLALRVGVMDKQTETRPLANRRVLQHLQVTIGVASGKDRPTSPPYRR